MIGSGQTGHEPLSQKRQLSLKLAIVARQMRMRFDDRIGRSGLTRANWTLIAVVARNPGATQKTIAETLQISEVSAGRLIDKLSHEGLLRRDASSVDRRAYHIYLTERAAPVLAEISTVAELEETHVFAGISQADLDAIERILGLIERNVEPHKAQGHTHTS